MKSSNLYNANTMHSNNLTSLNERGLDDSNINASQVFSHKGNFTQQIGGIATSGMGTSNAVNSIEKSMGKPLYQQQNYSTA